APEHFAREINRLFVARPQESVLPGTLRIGDFGSTVSTHTVTESEFCFPFAELWDALGLEFCTQSRLPQGEITNHFLEANRHVIVQLCQAMIQVQRKTNPETKTWTLNPDYDKSVGNPRAKSTFFLALRRTLTNIFSWAGYAMVDLCNRNSKIRKYTLSKNVCRLRYSLRGLQCDTFDEIVQGDAVVYFAEKYLVATGDEAPL